MRSSLILGCLLFPLFFGSTLVANNVLLIVVDDLNSRISPLGDTDAITPNLERLAEKSVTFTNAICQSPLCGPSRASFLSGTYPWDIGIKKAGGDAVQPQLMLPNRLFLHQYFSSQGYWTGSYGKVEHNLIRSRWDESTQRGTSQFPQDRVVAHRNFGDYSNVTGNSDFTIYDAPPHEFIDGQHATAAIAALNARAEDGQPFFIAVGFEKPHSPWRVPQSITDLYDPGAFTLPSDPEGSDGRWPSWTFPKGRSDPRPVMDDDTKRELFHAYYSSVTLMDSQLGRVLDTLDANEMWDDTVVLFLSDNGLSLMEHRRMFSKVNITREAVHVPLMIAAPGVEGGHLCHRQVGLTDVYPTLTDLAGIPPYCRRLEGVSVAPLLENPELPWDRVQLSNTASTGPNNSRVKARIAQYGPYKLVESLSGGGLPWIINHDLDHFELFPESAGIGAGGIDEEAYLKLTAATEAEISFAGHVYFRSPATYPYNRDQDNLPAEVEIDLKAFGFSPYVNDTERIHRLGLDLDSFGLVSSDSSSMRAKLAGLEIPEGFVPEHCYPFVLQKSADLVNWEDMEESLEWFGSEWAVDLPLDGNSAAPSHYRIKLK